MINKFVDILGADQPRRLDDTFGSVVENQCQTCARRNKDGSLRCEAFPDAIPAAIFLGAFDHTHLYDEDGQDDHGLLYEPIEAAPPSFMQLLGKNS